MFHICMYVPHLNVCVCGLSLMHITTIPLCAHKISAFFAHFDHVPGLKSQHLPGTKELTLVIREVTLL